MRELIPSISLNENEMFGMYVMKSTISPVWMALLPCRAARMKRVPRWKVTTRVHLKSREDGKEFNRKLGVMLEVCNRNYANKNRHMKQRCLWVNFKLIPSYRRTWATIYISWRSLLCPFKSTILQCLPNPSLLTFVWHPTRSLATDLSHTQMRWSPKYHSPPKLILTVFLSYSSADLIFFFGTAIETIFLCFWAQHTIQRNSRT